ncbi:MAG: hypothetical protein ACK4TA_20040 [Saprospiraceae bacterium]
MFFLIRGYNVKTPHITIESKDKQTKSNKEEEDCIKIKNKALKLREELMTEADIINDIDLKINLKYWEEKMTDLQNLDCN